MLRRPRYACFFSVVLLVFTVILVLNKPLFEMLFFQSTLPTEAADDVFISIEIDNGETMLCIDNQSKYYFRTGLPDFSDIEVYNNGKWIPIATEKISLLMAGIVPPNTTSCEAPYWSEAGTLLESGFYRVKFSGIWVQTDLCQESTFKTMPDTFVYFSIP